MDTTLYSGDPSANAAQITSQQNENSLPNGATTLAGRWKAAPAAPTSNGGAAATVSESSF